ncbi:MAG: DUF1476 domain-containing protein [Zymomonas mobilis subsp. pomaceae]|uniref:Aldolase n=1 Tax=Zymomonas mobilis subsp. pomaceae (strain ATCC 29192 / DSM 22645 / JCM 10191 / CCUG 17912 / NBRC 13757 / NCIMB 11200 / NRRL B-4491 / Barker I) TaxID=579138 RepID=F8EUB7_ZYMMT|nr:DUF1476 domain-containing protein [Zymomonas mobilis]AEI38138.1 protein of unknown function DUF1476 [Zymomonas mobilis subsp. pomaceae ATCC 29192]MDX5949505.1 DUF1476 domain-containing protein [Zymomonas mobilis subsp. pomaceae]GEB89248.1 hypothetical protein ZMO02_08850 [Zymomonas mobilis subsp. pomaceae]
MDIHSSGHRSPHAADSSLSSAASPKTEDLFSREQATLLRFLARRNRLLATWAAEMMHLTPEEADPYTKGFVGAGFEEMDEESIISRLLGDILSANVDVEESQIRAMLDRKSIEAKRQLLGAV